MNHSLIEKITLPNGLRVVLLPNGHNLSASVSLWVGSGSRFERPETAGASHFIEHMLFKGTDRRTARGIAEEMDGIGGQMNAYTTKEYTCYYARALRDHLPLAVDILCDMIVNSRFDEDDINLERGVILEEIGMYDDSPEDILLDGLYSSVWPDNMLGSNILGSRETVSDMTSGVMREHMARQYTGRRMVCAIAGSFDRNAIIAQITGALGKIPRGEIPFEATQAVYRPNSFILDKDFEQAHICIGFPSVGQGDERRHALGLLSSICGGTGSSRLFQRLREDLGLCYSVGCTVTPYLREGLLDVDAAVSPENIEPALREITRVLCALRRDGVTENELIRAKEQTKASIIMGLESSSAVAAHMARGEIMRGKILSEEEIIAQIDGVTIEDVNAAAREFINFDISAVCGVGNFNAKKRQDNYCKTIVNDAVF
ncbi:MAG: insulinase family protein [Oscillospiraceae bacterium]|nr:insulinase family protein [Oscillospiraceae bacterium]